MITAESTKTKVIISFYKDGSFRLERRKNDGPWLIHTGDGWENGGLPVEIVGQHFLDADIEAGHYEYRAVSFTPDDVRDEEYEYSGWIVCGNTEPVGYSFGNYVRPGSEWGETLTPDDLRYTYLWGVDCRASNGQPYTDAQFKFFIDSATSEVARRLNITIRKTRIKSDPADTDFDEEEPLYRYRRELIGATGRIPLRRRPVLSVDCLELLCTLGKVINLKESMLVDKQKGLIRFMQRPYQSTALSRSIDAALGMYGTNTRRGPMFYRIDYTAGYETSDDIPDDLRACIGKVAAIELLNVIGDGLIAGFSSSSLSMDGVSESFSSTQSATSAYFGARIKVYEDEVVRYIKDQKHKFGHFVMGMI